MKVLISCILVLFASTTLTAETQFDLETAGDHSVWILVNDIKPDFEKKTGLSMNLIPELAIVGKGCAKGQVKAVTGEPDKYFGLICCILDDHTIKKSNLKIYPFAREPMAIIVNRDNPVDDLTLDQVRDIFSGKISNWKTVGGRDRKIVVITQLHCKKYTPNWMGIFRDPGKFTRNRLDVTAQPKMAKMVSDFREAIGHLEMTSVVENSDVSDVKVLSINGYMPTTENMEKGLYPLYGPLAIITKGEARGNVVRFIDYIRTDPDVRQVMKKYGVAQIRK